jgi:hypothetical protein
MKHVEVRTDVSVEVSQAPTSPEAPAAPPLPITPLASGKRETLRNVGYAAFAFVAVVSTYAGVVYWAIQGWIWGVALSVLVPGFGLVSLIWDISP